MRVPRLTRASLRPRPRTFLAHRFVALAERWLDRRFIAIDPPAPPSRPRYGHGRPPHPRLLEILSAAEDIYARNLETIAGYAADLERIPRGPTEGLAWLNAWLPPIDGAALYGFLRSRNPPNYVEVGSGVSTLFARRAVEDGGLGTRITSIDPAPRVAVDEACDRVLREPLESLDLELFTHLDRRDVVLMDGSHHALTNSDATAFFLDVLPSLPAGVLACVHDVLLPDDYLPEWIQWNWSVMATYLLGGGQGIELELASWYAHAHSDLHRILDPVWSSPDLADVPRFGVGLWFTASGS